MIKLLTFIALLLACKPVPELARLSADINGGLGCPGGLGEVSGIDFLDGKVYAVSDGGGFNGIGIYSPSSGQWDRRTISGTANTDWESLAIGPCPSSGAQCAYIGDLGDNGISRGGGKIYVVDLTSFSLVNTINVSYSDGRSHNVEALAIDTQAPHDIYVIHKHWTGDNSSAIWKINGDEKNASSVVLNKVCDLTRANSWDSQITGADIAGDYMVYRGYGYVATFDMKGLRRNECVETPFVSDLGGTITESNDNQLEAIAYTSASSLVTISEQCQAYSGPVIPGEPSAGEGNVIAEPNYAGNSPAVTPYRSRSPGPSRIPPNRGTNQ